MKKNLLMCLLALSSIGLLSNVQSKEITVKAEAEQKTEVLVAEELTWSSANAGWGDVKKNKLWNDAPIIVNGVDYSHNSIGTHIPLGVENNADIVYDISQYSSQYELFEVMVAQPDGGNNMCHFQVLVDDVLVDDIYWRKSGDANLSEQVHSFSYNPVWMRANIKGASKLTLRAKESGYGQGDGVCAWIQPRFFNSDETRVYASDILERVGNTSTTGWDYGHGNVPILDGKANGNSLYFEGTLQRYQKGIGTQLKGSNYDNYAANKSDSNSYVSMKFDIEGKGFTLFNTLVQMDLSFGCYVDTWVDGQEIYHSDLINSNGTYAATGQWIALAPQSLNVKIPANAKEFEIRVIPENGIGDGLINLCEAAFYRQNEYLYTMYAEETYGQVWPFEVARGRDQSSAAPVMYNAFKEQDITYDNGIYMVGGDAINAPANYSYDIEGLDYNCFSATIGATASNKIDGHPKTFYADVVYKDGSKKTYQSELITNDKSGSEFTFVYDNKDATRLELYILADDAGFTESVWGDAKLSKKAVANYYVNGETYISQGYDLGEALVKPTNPVVDGYDFKYWTYNDAEFNFDNQNINGNMDFTAVLEAKTYNISYKQMLDGVVSDATYSPVSYKYGTQVNIPEANNLEGYTFEGWYLGETKVENALSNQIGNLELVAKYSINEYTVKFVDGDKETISTVKHGERVEEVQPDARRYYVFDGWYINDVKFDFNTIIKEPIELEARFVGEQFDITYKVQKDSELTSTSEYDVTTHTYGIDTALPTAKAIEGYTFVGWYVDGNKVTVLEKDQYFEDIELVAKYNINQYTVRFVLDEIELSSSTVNYGDLVVEVAAPIKDGYNFIGWYANDELYNFEDEVKSDLTLVAKFEAIPVEEPVKKGCKGSFGSIISLSMLLISSLYLVSKKKEN